MRVPLDKSMCNPTYTVYAPSKLSMCAACLLHQFTGGVPVLSLWVGTAGGRVTAYKVTTTDRSVQLDSTGLWRGILMWGLFKRSLVSRLCAEPSLSGG